MTDNRTINQILADAEEHQREVIISHQRLQKQLKKALYMEYAMLFLVGSLFTFWAIVLWDWLAN